MNERRRRQRPSVNVAVNGPALTNTATQYQFGAANFAGNNPPPLVRCINEHHYCGVGNSVTINDSRFQDNRAGFMPSGATRCSQPPIRAMGQSL